MSSGFGIVLRLLQSLIGLDGSEDKLGALRRVRLRIGLCGLNLCLEGLVFNLELGKLVVD